MKEQILRYSSYLVLALGLQACAQSTPSSPEDLGIFYWESLQEGNFEQTGPYWANIRELNKLMELVPGLKRFMSKGSYYSEQVRLKEEKEIFLDILQVARDRHLNLKQADFKKANFRTWIKEQGIQVGQQTIDIDFPDQTLKLRLLMIFSNHRWRYLGLYYYQVKQKEGREGQVEYEEI